MKLRKQTVRLVAGIRRNARRTNFVKMAAKTAVYSMVPSALNDVVVHHANLSVSEIQNVATDTIIISAMSVALKTFVPL